MPLVFQPMNSMNLSVCSYQVSYCHYVLYPSLWLGGTVDTTGHEVLPNGKLKEIDSSSGGPWGGNLVNDAFEDFITELVTHCCC